MFGKKSSVANMLKAVPLGSAARAKRQRRALWRALLWTGLLLVALLLVALPFALAGYNAYRQADAGREALSQVEQSIAELDLIAAEVQAEQAATYFENSQAEFAKLKILMPLPWIGERLAAVDRLLTAGQLSAAAVSETAGIGRQVLEAVNDTGLNGLRPNQLIPEGGLGAMTTTDRQRVLAALAESAPKMRTALDRIEAALTSLDTLPNDPLIAPYTAQLVSARDKLDTTSIAIEAVLPVVEALPTALGYPVPQRYLFFFQNNTEMRPSGGFLGLVGQATVANAELTDIIAEDTYAYDQHSETVSRPPAPAPLQQYVGVQQWYLRDANWSPDFTVSAPRMEQFFREEALVRDGVEPAPFDGVIAITPDIVEDVLRMTGPITVDDVTFTADNLVDELEFQVEIAFAEQGIDRDERKVIVHELMKLVIEELQRFTLPQLMDLVAIVKTNMAEGHLLAWSRHAPLQALLLENDWAGQLQDVRGDYLMVVDANLASLKSDPAVDRQIDYRIRPLGNTGDYEATVDITYTNRGQFDWKTTRYRTFTRVYVPEGSQLLGVEGAMRDDKLRDPGGNPGEPSSGTDAGRQWFGAFISTEPGESRTLTFRYRVARSVQAVMLGGDYRLLVERQPGSAAHGLTLDLDFGKKLTAATPPEKAENWGNTRYQIQSDLALDRLYQVQFAPTELSALTGTPTE
jgi:hypothetical protein